MTERHVLKMRDGYSPLVLQNLLETTEDKTDSKEYTIITYPYWVIISKNSKMKSLLDVSSSEIRSDQTL